MLILNWFIDERVYNKEILGSQDLQTPLHLRQHIVPHVSLLVWGNVGQYPFLSERHKFLLQLHHDLSIAVRLWGTEVYLKVYGH